ncbi:MAG TPA: hypothetical protein VFM18_18205 [Methanosarcina sp.]|nr:hypothetical protein [Methanosarcina sp.]
MTSIAQLDWYRTGQQALQQPGTTTMFYQISCNYEISDWLHEQFDSEEWRYDVVASHRTGSPTYWVTAYLLTILTLKWPVTYIPTL